MLGPITIPKKTLFPVDKSKTNRFAKLALNKVDWQKLNGIVLERPFQTYCYSNIDKLLSQWLRWFNKLLNKNVPNVTTHRATLPPWISKETSHIVKKNWKQCNEKTEKKATISKIIQLNDEISNKTAEDQLDYETEVFISKKFSKIQLI